LNSVINLCRFLFEGARNFSRTPLVKDGTKDSINPVVLSSSEEEIKRLRFPRHISAFDVDISKLEDHPWRNKNIDVSDYFNYGFTERTWMVYE
jgi:hypothetical protein